MDDLLADQFVNSTARHTDRCFGEGQLDAFGAPIGGLHPTHTMLLTVFLGALLGVLVSLSSVGAGALGMTCLLLLYPTLPAKRLVGSDIAHAVPFTCLAGIGHWWLGTIDMGLLLALLAGSVPGVTIGSWVAARASDRWLRPILAGTLGVAGIRLSL
jgi:uncharacterized membrane protein YfcA